MPEETTPSVAPLAEINLGPSKFEQFLDNNQKTLAVLLAVAVVASAVYIVIRGVEKSREHSAGAALSKATDSAALREVFSSHANTNAAASAKLLLADMQASEGETDASIKTLQDFIATHNDHPARATASARLGACLMSQGKNAEASSIFQQIVSDPLARYIAPYALISLGDIAKIGGDTAKAESYFNKVKSEFPESSFINLANERLNSVQAKPPVEVQPAAPEAKKEPVAQPAPTSPTSAPAPAPAKNQGKATKKKN